MNKIKSSCLPVPGKHFSKIDSTGLILFTLIVFLLTFNLVDKEIHIEVYQLLCCYSEQDLSWYFSTLNIPVPVLLDG